MQYENQSTKIQGDKLETFNTSSYQPPFSFKTPVSQDLEKKQGDPLFDALPNGPAPVVAHVPKLAETLPEYRQGEITSLDQTPVAKESLDLKAEAQIGLEEAREAATGMMESASSKVQSVFSSALGAIKDGAAYIVEKKDALVENVKQAAVHAQYERVLGEVQYGFHQLKPVAQFEQVLKEIETSTPQLKHAELYPNKEYRQVMDELESKPAQLKPVGQFEKILSDIESNPTQLKPVGEYQEVLSEIQGSQPALRPVGQFQEVLKDIESQPKPEFKQLLSEIEAQPSLRPVGQFQEVLKDIESQPKPEFKQLMSEIESKPALRPVAEQQQFENVLGEIEGSRPALRPVAEKSELLREIETAEGQFDLKPLNRRPTAEFREVLNEIEAQPQLKPTGEFQEVLKDIESGSFNLRSEQPVPPPLSREIQSEALEVPAIYETIQKPTIVHETVKTNELIEIQPVIERERERLVVEEIVQPMRQLQIETPQIREVVLPPKTMPVVKEDDSKFVAEHSAPIDVSTTESSFESSTIYDAPIIHEHVVQKVIEEIQPIVYREVQRPVLLKETQTIYEKIVEAPVLKKRVLPMQDLGVVKTEKYVERPLNGQGVDLPAESK